MIDKTPRILGGIGKRGKSWQMIEMEQNKIVVMGSLNPTKECQDRVRVFSSGGISPAIRATDYKDPPKLIVAK